jgi:8-oxo-dGTP pyrophosphatase MutT (NUDIX family)
MKSKVICRDLDNNKYEVSPEELSFRPSVYGILIEDGNIMLSRQWDGYDFPGGGVDLDETLEEALKREFFEETGLLVNVSEVFHAESSFFKPSHSEKRKNENWNCPMIYFFVEKTGGSLSTDNFDENEKAYAKMAEWVDLGSIDDIKFTSTVDNKKILQKAIKIRG